MQFLSLFAESLAQLMLLILSQLFFVKFERVQLFELIFALLLALLFELQSFFVKVVRRECWFLLSDCGIITGFIELSLPFGFLFFLKFPLLVDFAAFGRMIVQLSLVFLQLLFDFSYKPHFFIITNGLICPELFFPFNLSISLFDCIYRTMVFLDFTTHFELFVRVVLLHFLKFLLKDLEDGLFVFGIKLIIYEKSVNQLGDICVFRYSDQVLFVLDID